MVIEVFAGNTIRDCNMHMQARLLLLLLSLFTLCNGQVLSMIESIIVVQLPAYYQDLVARGTIDYDFTNDVSGSIGYARATERIDADDIEQFVFTDYHDNEWECHVTVGGASQMGVVYMDVTGSGPYTLTITYYDTDDHVVRTLLTSC